jgi:hypothetical protein
MASLRFAAGEVEEHVHRAGRKKTGLKKISKLPKYQAVSQPGDRFPRATIRIQKIRIRGALDVIGITRRDM